MSKLGFATKVEEAEDVELGTCKEAWKPVKRDPARLTTYLDRAWLERASSEDAKNIADLHAQVLRDCGESYN